MAYELGANPLESTGLMVSVSYLLLLSNTIGMVFRANSSGDHSLLAFIFSICSSFLLLEYCHSVYHQLPRGQNSVRKSILAVAIWCLFTGIVFGITSQCAPYFNFAFALTMHAAAFVASAVIFHAYIIYDDDDDCAVIPPRSAVMTTTVLASPVRVWKSILIKYERTQFNATNKRSGQ